jgi:CheY-like chemotaxis protein
MNKQRNIRVLIVEDETGDARLMQLALQKCGFPVELQFAGDGGEALRLLRRQGENFQTAARPDLILLDLKMPGNGGLRFLHEIKQDERLLAIPVVVVTTSMLESDVLESYRHGAAGYVPKFTDLNEFMAAISTLGQYWFGLARLPLNIE